MSTRISTQVLLQRIQRSFHCSQNPRGPGPQGPRVSVLEGLKQEASPQPFPEAHPRKSDESGKDGTGDLPLAEFSLKYQEGIQPFSPRHPHFSLQYTSSSFAGWLSILWRGPPPRPGGTRGKDPWIPDPSEHLPREIKALVSSPSPPPAPLPDVKTKW
ncbi:nck-associated protein 5-like [Piliocolobus tephrosceles]|uniref:nck-associated protein 5-like n=1 Tax=Piliocolobus tephrosceles TaxID=591936 RepID=UPI000E6B2493|nr:nck-associated protein 5-like [Piliocolobus tephrosceles]